MDKCSAPYEGREPYVFFSYCRKNSDLAYPIINGLLRSGCRVWYDQGIRVGGDWPEIIAGKLEQCVCFVVMLTEESEESTNCKNEFTLASKLKKPMVAVKTGSVVLDFGMMLNLGEREPFIVEQYSPEELVGELLKREELKDCIDTARKPDPEPDPEPEPEPEPDPEPEPEPDPDPEPEPEPEPMGISALVKELAMRMEQPDIKGCKAVVAAAAQPLEELREQIRALQEQLDALLTVSGNAEAFLAKTLEESRKRIAARKEEYDCLKPEAEDAAAEELKPYIDRLESLIREAEAEKETLRALGESSEEAEGFISEARELHKTLLNHLDSTIRDGPSGNSTLRDYPLPLRIIRLSTGECWKKTRERLRVGYAESFDIPLCGEGAAELKLGYVKGGYALSEAGGWKALENPCVLPIGKESLYLAWGAEQVRTDADGLRWLYAPAVDEYRFLPSGDSFVGRNRGWEGIALKNERVSYDHLLFHCVGEGAACTVSVEDHGREGNGSTNGTDVNGELLRPRKPVTIYEGDRITAGAADAVLEYHSHIGSGGPER